jgi:hypothetical protein
VCLLGSHKVPGAEVGGLAGIVESEADRDEGVRGSPMRPSCRPPERSRCPPTQRRSWPRGWRADTEPCSGSRCPSRAPTSRNENLVPRTRSRGHMQLPEGRMVRLRESIEGDPETRGLLRPSGPDGCAVETNRTLGPPAGCCQAPTGCMCPDPRTLQHEPIGGRRWSAEWAQGSL